MIGRLGGGGGLRGHGELPLNADINVTSLVDIAFVLLIIFMMVAPIMQGGVDVQLPKAEARPITAKDGVVVSVDGSRVFITNAFAGTVSTIDAATQRVTGTVRVGTGPGGITYRPASH